MHKPESTNPNRRQFLNSSAVALSGALAMPHILTTGARGDSPGETLRVGLVGCGGRGTGAASDALGADKNVALVSLGDLFEGQIERSLNSLKKEHAGKVKVEPDRCFSGLDAYQKVIESGVDVVLLATPPGFRPQHLKAAVEAGKHVFAEKPVATDAFGVRTVLEAAELAKKNHTSVVSGFCWRSHLPKRAAFGRVLEGAVGDINTVYTTYNTGPVKDQTPRKEGWSDLETQLRNWYQFTWLSGDHIAEQAVHSLDMMSWAMGDKPPLRVHGNGGRQTRKNLGNIYDHFAIVYEYEGGARGFHFCRQISGCATDYSVNIAGTKGSAIIDCSRDRHQILGENSWRYDGEKNDMYQTEHDEFFAAIRAGKPLNQGTWMAQSTMLAIAGRMAAYTGQVITWEQAMNSQERLVPEKLTMETEMPLPPVAMPGRTKFI